MSSSDKKSKFLGMSHSTACNQLRKLIMFSLVVELNKDICIRCNKKIESVNDLSIDHIEPWENIDIAKFWDIKNIGFSHCSCNKPHKYHGSSGRIPWNKPKCPEGMNWCGGICKKFLPLSRFSRNKSRYNGLESMCKDCRKHYVK